MTEQYYIDNVDEYKNKQFGNWLVLGLSSFKRNKYKQAQYRCKCLLCGKIKHRVAKYIVNTDSDKHPISCGCTSRGVFVINKFLSENQIEFQTEVTFQGLKSPKGRPLRFDFVIIVEMDGSHKYYAAIEFDGRQHTDVKVLKKISRTRYISDAREKLYYNSECDRLKEEYCQEHELYFLRIPYSNDMRLIQSQLKDFLTVIGFSEMFDVV